MILLVLFVLRVVNIPLTAFTFLGGAIAIGIGFGAQNLINNFISGFIIFFRIYAVCQDADWCAGYC